MNNWNLIAFLSAKKSEGLRAPTIKSYEEHYPDVMLVAELTSPIIRKYLVYMKEDHFNYKTKTNDLSIQTVNARLRFLMR
ncbi:hypothetical protein [Domibacillus aminovorans]|nr:hypothetical protein [Domibacillus aminovorans]